LLTAKDICSTYLLGFQQIDPSKVNFQDSDSGLEHAYKTPFIALFKY
jgi:hypothetical protein